MHQNYSAKKYTSRKDKFSILLKSLVPSHQGNMSCVLDVHGEKSCRAEGFLVVLGHPWMGFGLPQCAQKARMRTTFRFCATTLACFLPTNYLCRLLIFVLREKGSTTLAKKIETGTHVKLQACACSRDHAPVPAGTWLSQFFWPGY